MRTHPARVQEIRERWGQRWPDSIEPWPDIAYLLAQLEARTQERDGHMRGAAELCKVAARNMERAERAEAALHTLSSRATKSWM